MNIRNLTPHAVNMPNQTIPSEGSVRLSEDQETIGQLPDGTPLLKTSYGAGDSLPPSQEGTIFIVSRMVVDAFPERTDLFAPANVVRDEDGRITGCLALSR